MLTKGAITINKVLWVKTRKNLLMGGVPIRKNSKKARTRNNTYITKHSSSANNNYNTLSADSAAIEIHNIHARTYNQKQTRINNFIYKIILFIN